MKGNVESLSRR